MSGQQDEGNRHALVRGYCLSGPAQRNALLSSTAFTVTVATSRILNYVRERRRPMPRVRSLGRVLAHTPSSDSVRVHHFLPGVGIGLLSGGLAVHARSGPFGTWLSPGFGVGLALTLDELPLMAGRSNPYWGGERFAGALVVVGALVMLGMATATIDRARNATQVEQRHLAAQDDETDEPIHAVSSR